MFTKLLIANRGEIACRIIRTARRLGVTTVAVYSEVDRDALHVELADQAYLIGPPPATESYLNQEAILKAAEKSGAEAVHPGYGFLAENADFARTCAESGLLFVGPPPEAIAAMGDKTGARRRMRQAGVPVVPGCEGDRQALLRGAREVGYPLLIKASAGGGGKGMRVVRTEAELPEALEAARREAAAAFGDPTLLLEKFLAGCRHVEVQVFADVHGQCLHLFERDCSLQRRYQKVLEEAPAPGLTPELRDRMSEAAIAAARAVDYVGAGTVEFLLTADGAFFFNEMNTRLQVEHPVTELVTGLDLVEWQLRVAAGEPLPLSQEQIHLCGHAVEARLYAEDPGHDFLPAGGRLLHLRFPSEVDGVRVDTGVREGDAVGLHYDPLLAKIIAHGEDRPVALRRLQQALAVCAVAGTTTNLELLRRTTGHPAFIAGEVETGFLTHHQADLLPPREPAPEQILALAALYLLLARLKGKERSPISVDPFSPWGLADGWRAGGPHRQILILSDRERSIEIAADREADGFLLHLPSGPRAIRGCLEAGRTLHAELAGETLRAVAIRHGRQLFLVRQGTTWRLEINDPLAAHATTEQAGGGLRAPMPGRILAIKVREGERVGTGAPLVVLEAMKMEHTIAAPGEGTVREIRFREGEQVAEGAELLVFAADGEEEP